jgi:hypothetical protein
MLDSWQRRIWSGAEEDTRLHEYRGGMSVRNFIFIGRCLKALGPNKGASCSREVNSVRFGHIIACWSRSSRSSLARIVGSFVFGLDFVGRTRIIRTVA